MPNYGLLSFADKDMRVLLQRALESQVIIEKEEVGKIDQGLLLLLGIYAEDAQEDIDWLVRKIMHLRVFSDANGKMNLSVQEIAGEILVVSQFTLYADCRKGNRPSYLRSAPPVISEPIYEQFVQTLCSQCQGKVATGRFGAEMRIHLIQ